MAIGFDERLKTFYLSGENFSYVFRIGNGGYLNHLYFGEKIRKGDIGYIAENMRAEFSPLFDENFLYDSLDVVPQEFPIYAKGDFREPSVIVETVDGARLTDFKYLSHEILKSKPKLVGMPSLSGGETLVIYLYDELHALTLRLFYTVYSGYGAVARRTELYNGGDTVYINKLNSFNVDFMRSDFDKIALCGGWGRERGVERSALTHGIYEVSSIRGSSSHQINPFLALCGHNADEFSGQVYGVNLIYSCSFSIKAQVDQLGITRLGGGINEKDFCWKLNSGETFATPEAVLVYSGEGFNKMSQNFHDLYRNCLINPAFAFKKRPIVLNCWESFYFDFNEKSIFALIEKAKGTGIDTFVLDDGWFGKRNGEKSGLGDWRVNREKLAGGLKPVIDKCISCGMKFGIWIEPEMVNEDSDLYRAHPDWIIKANGAKPCKGRFQFVLDYSNPEVIKYIKGEIYSLLKENDISYVKWDMNRNITEAYSGYLKDNSRELSHRYILGVYELAEFLTGAFPDVFFEGCSGGGGRFDPAMLKYFPQIWTSDNTDALSRAYIQYGTSFVYPLSAMSGHISVCPNHQTGRITPFKSRSDVAAFCSTGFELDLNALKKDEFSKISEHVKFYESISELILKGDLYRLKSPFEGNYFSQAVVSKDKKKSALILMKKSAFTTDFYPIIKLKGLNPDYEYEINGKIYGGDVLMNVGLKFKNNLKDCETVSLVLTALER